MQLNRRDFAKTLGIASLSALVLPKTVSASVPTTIIKNLNNKMKLSFKPFELEMKHTFTVAEFSRNSTPDVLTQIEYEGLIGYGEASMPPYLGESIASVTKFLQKVNLEQFSDPFRVDDILTYVDSIEADNPAAKASIDIALHDLIGKIVNQPLYKLWGLNPMKTPNTSFTIGMDKPEMIRLKTKEANGFKVLKIKLGLNNDKEMINTVREITDVPLYVDVNQGWTDKKKALEMIFWLKEKGVLFVEQPMPKTQIMIWHGLQNIALCQRWRMKLFKDCQILSTKSMAYIQELTSN
ncbi:MAG: enolase C-terminal domain-like protein [Lutibacter sp.]|jgi:L-alanine-DL-glutamate epimerase-like enolase superfamily enzyme